jgi:hypothetical protein
MYKINNIKFGIEDLVDFSKKNINSVENSNEINIEQFKLIVGASPYKIRPLIGINWGVYSSANNNIAFFKSSNDKPCSLIRVLSMLLKSTQLAIKLLDDLDKNFISQEILAKFLYYKTYVAFVNRENLSPTNISHFLLNVTDMLIIGTTFPYMNFVKNALKINSSIKVSIVIHTSSNNYNDYRYFDTWYLFKDLYLTQYNQTPLTMISKF